MALTPAQVEHYRRILVAHRDELVSGTARAEAEVSEQDDLARRDYGDRATSDTAKADLLEAAGRESEALAQIESALRHINDKTYGICDQCGQEIPRSRLDAVPWALLCVHDQEISDRKRRADGTMTGGAPSRVVR
jgi:DnaK suppressor protein